MHATYFGDPSRVNDEVARYQAVTAEQVSAFARERLGPDNRAALLFVPREGDPDDESAAGEHEPSAERRESSAGVTA
jgi:hypothetical protein